MNDHPLPSPPAFTSVLRPLRPEIKLSVERPARVQAALERIASISIPSVTKEHGHRVFAMTVQCETDNETNGCAQGWGLSSSMEPTSTDVQVKRRFVDFWDLRHELLYRASSSHRHEHLNQQCAFCTRILNALEQAPALPRAHQRVFYNHDALRQELEDFAHLVLQLSTHAPPGRWCKARDVVPSLVQEFLLGDDQDNNSDASPSSKESSGWVYTFSW